MSKQTAQFLAIHFSDSTVQTAFVTTAPSGVNTHAQSTALHYTDTKSAIVKTDEALQELGAESESVQEALFICDPHWFEGTALSAEKERRIREVARELSLKPLGFVLTHEAVVHTAAANNPQFSAVLVVVGVSHISTTIVSQGAIVSTEQVRRSDSLQDDIIAALQQFAKAQSQAKLAPELTLIVSGADSQEQAALTASLSPVAISTALPFVSPPHITAMSQDVLFSTLITEAGRAVAVAKGFTPAQPVLISGSTSDEALPAPAVAPSLPTNSEFRSNDLEVVDPAAIGLETFDEDDVPPVEKKKRSPVFYAVLGVGIGVGCLIIAFIILLRFFSVVVVAVDREPKTVALDTTFILDTAGSEVDAQARTIPAEKIMVEVVETGVSATSGVTIVGEKATGELTIINKTTGEKEFAAGTLLTAGTNQFELTESVVVPPTVVTEKTGGEEREYGQANAPAKARIIGEEANVSEGTSFTIESFDTSTYEAKAQGDFTGGTSREVSVVSQDDLDSLLDELRKLGLAQARDELAAQSSGDAKLHFTDLIEREEAEFSHELGDEASEIELSLTMTVSALAYQRSDLEPLVASVLKEVTPEGYSLQLDALEVLSAPEEASTSAGEYAIAANISTQALPQVDAEAIAASIGGRRFDDAVALIENEPTLTGARVELEPSIAKVLVRQVPTNTKRVRVVVQ